MFLVSLNKALQILPSAMCNMKVYNGQNSCKFNDVPMSSWVLAMLEFKYVNSCVRSCCFGFIFFLCLSDLFLLSCVIISSLLFLVLCLSLHSTLPYVILACLRSPCVIFLACMVLYSTSCTLCFCANMQDNISVSRGTD